MENDHGRSSVAQQDDAFDGNKRIPAGIKDAGEAILKRRVMMKKNGLLLSASVVLCFALVTFAGAATAAEKVYQWKWYSPYNLTISSMDQLPDHRPEDQ
jgi:hypothetical protein